MISKLKFTFFLLLLFVSRFSHSQQYFFSNITTENGLSQAQVLSILQDDAGVMWFGTNDGGITKYDGSKFEYITTKNGLVDNVVYSILQYDKSTFLVGTNNGVSFIRNNKIINYNIEDKLTSNRIFDIIKLKNNEVLLGTGKGVCEFEKGFFERRNFGKLLDSAAVFNIYEDTKGGIWFSTLGSGVFYFQNGALQNINSANGLKENFVYSVSQKDEFNFWLCTSAGLFNMNVESGIVTPVFEKDIPDYYNTQFYSVDNDSAGNIWIASSIGVYKYRNSLEKISTQNGLVNNNVWKIYIDREKNVWFGSKENGISVLPDLAWEHYGEQNGLTGKTINVISKFGMEMYCGTDEGFSIFKNNKFVSYGNSNGLISGEALCLQIDSKGYAWIGTNSGISKFSNGKFINYEFDKKLLNKYNRCYDLLIESDNKIWLGTLAGLAVVENGKLSPVTFDGVSSPKSIYNLFMSSDKTLWMGCDDGLYSMKNNSLKRYSAKDGISEKRINCVTVDEKGVLWVATNEGIYYLNETKFLKISVADGLSSNNAYSIAFDRQQRLWVGEPNGVDRIELNNYKIVKVTHFDGDNGFAGKDCRSNSVYVDDSTGHIYFGTVNGLMVYRPEYEKKTISLPLVKLNSVNLFSQITNWKEHTDSVDWVGMPVNLELPFSKNYLTFNFVGVSLSAPAKVRYQYMLKGLDKDWLPVTAKTEAIYSNLPPNKYEFLVKSANENNVWSAPQSFKFVILPPFYKTWWFYSLCIAIVIGGIFSYVKIRSANIQITRQSRIIEKNNKDIQMAYVEIAQAHQNITDSIRYAKRLQDAILPAERHIHALLPNSFVIYKPKDIVSGDFYWMVNKGGKILIAAIDCTGHGVPGALVSIVGNNGLMRTVNEFGLTKPAEILDKLSVLVEETLQQNDEAEVRDGMDMALCSFDNTKKVLEYSGANNPLYFVRVKNGQELVDNGKVLSPLMFNETHCLYEIKPDKQPIGLFERRKGFTNHSINFTEGDTIYIFSDGYADQFGGAKGKKFLYRSLRELLLSIQGKQMKDQKVVLETAFENWRGSHEQVDDVCVIGIKL